MTKFKHHPKKSSKNISTVSLSASCFELSFVKRICTLKWQNIFLNLYVYVCDCVYIQLCICIQRTQCTNHAQSDRAEEVVLIFVVGIFTGKYKIPSSQGLGLSACNIIFCMIIIYVLIFKQEKGCPYFKKKNVIIFCTMHFSNLKPSVFEVLQCSPQPKIIHIRNFFSFHIQNCWVI